MLRATRCVLFSVLLCTAQENRKQFKEGEFDRYNAAVKDINAAAFPKAIADLDLWKQHDPDSDYKDERSALYVQAYSGVNEPAKTLAEAGTLMGGDLKTVFPGPAGLPTILRLLYSASWAITRLSNPTQGESATGERAARELLAADTPLPGVSADKWKEARADMTRKATAALVYLAMLPGMRAMQKQPPDCPAAEAAYTNALKQYPEQSVLSYELARALICVARADATKQTAAIFEFQRAAVTDSTLGGARSDPKQVENYADSIYVKFHGSEEGLDHLRQMVRTAPLPPADFAIQSAEEIAAIKEKELEAQNPQLALWNKIKTALSQPDGEQYFENDLKGAAVPQLAGRLIEAKPACRPRELLVAVPQAGSQPLAPEIQLRLDKPLAGKPAIGANFEWEGVPSAFVARPFLLTMETEASKIGALEMAPCDAAPRNKGAPRH